MRVLLHLLSDSLSQATVLSLHSSLLPARGLGEDRMFWPWFGHGLGEDRAIWPWFGRGSYVFGHGLGEDRTFWPLYGTFM